MKTRLTIPLLVLCASILAAQALPAPPLAPEHPDTLSLHGHILVDHWSWLRDRENPQLPAVLEAEGRYAEWILKPSAKVYKEIMSLSSPSASEDLLIRADPEDGYYYYSRSYANKDYVKHFRIKDEPGAREELLLDENKLARGKSYFDLGLFEVSRDARWLAYSTDTVGDERYRLFIKDLISKETLATAVTNLDDALWLPDNRSLLLTTTNSSFRSDSLWIFDLPSQQLRSLMRESDPTFTLGLELSSDRELVFVYSSDGHNDEYWYLKADSAQPILVPIVSRTDSLRIVPDHAVGKLYLMSDHANPDFGLYSATLDSLDIAHWALLVEGVIGEPLEDYRILRDAVAVLRRQAGFHRIELRELTSGRLFRLIAPPEPSCLGFVGDSDPEADTLYYCLENGTTDYCKIRHSLSDGKEMIVSPDLWTSDVFYPNYRCELHWVATSDGARVPLRLYMRKDLDTSIANPLWLYGYGAYGDSENPYFSTSVLTLLNHGFIYAVAHVRGGGELGQAWYAAGLGPNKTNSFSDFTACLDYLIGQGYTAADKLVVEGASAGGLLMGAVLNLCPEKIRFAILDVPFVDVLNTMLDPSLPLTAGEYDEWGDPKREEDFSNILSYSPYENVRPAIYPTVLASAGWNDTRVGYFESLKWVQKLRLNNPGPNPIVYLLSRNSGHSGSGAASQSLADFWRLRAYVIWELLYK